MYIAITTGFLYGFMGSVHCLGMCGPIALALPVSGKGYSHAIFGRIAYNLGRSFTYATLGLIISIAGVQAIPARYQNFLSITCGILIIVLAGISLFGFKLSFLHTTFFTRKAGSFLKKFMKNSGIFSLFLMGVINGFLPCGFVVYALVMSLSFMNTSQSVSFMIAFGMGTFPAMMAASLFGNFMHIHWRKMLIKAGPVIAAFLGAIIIYRGMHSHGPNSHPPKNSSPHEQHHHH